MQWFLLNTRYHFQPLVTFGHSWLEMAPHERQKPFHFLHTSDGKQILIPVELSLMIPHSPSLHFRDLEKKWIFRLAKAQLEMEKKWVFVDSHWCEENEMVFVSHEVPFPATSDRRTQVAGNGTEWEVKTIELSSSTSGGEQWAFLNFFILTAVKKTVPKWRKRTMVGRRNAFSG